MTARQAAALSLRIDIGEKTRIVVRDALGVVQVDTTTEFSRMHLDDIHGPLREDLDNFCGALGIPEQNSIRKVCDALLRLQKRGRSILLDLFKGRTEERLRTAALCRQICPSWVKSEKWPSALAPPLVTVQMTRGSGIPIELLPLMEFRTPDSMHNDLSRVASSFLGFSAIVKRETPRPTSQGSAPRLENEPRLPIKIFISRDLGGAQADDDHLRSHAAIDLDVAWPPTNMPESQQFCRDLARHLWCSDRTITGETRRPPFQISHFSCHCDTTRPTSGRYFLKFSSLLRNREVTIDDLRDELSALREEQDEPTLRSLVIMNACGSAGLYPSGANSFPDLFLNNDFGFLGFVGTEASVPDGFASLFTRKFYEYLLRAWPIGLALHAARWDILNSMRNPLGIIYTLHAEPEIQIRVPPKVTSGSQSIINRTKNDESPKG